MKRICWYPRVKGWRKPAGAVWVGRPSRWGNPYDWREHGRDAAVELFRQYLAAHPELITAAQRELAGMDLACRCPIGEPCHADVWIEAITKAGSCAGADLCGGPSLGCAVGPQSPQR